jgi:hypothetical protein
MLKNGDLQNNQTILRYNRQITKQMQNHSDQTKDQF